MLADDSLRLSKGETITLAGEPTLPAQNVSAAPPSSTDFVIDSVIGEGGMGIVYLAHDARLDRKVAIKVLRREHVRGASAAARLVREARAMAQLAHPNVVAVHELGIIGQELFIAMEYVEGGTLRQWQASRRGWRDLVDAYVQAGRGLAAAHRAGLVHRDFKPENVLVGGDGRPRVTDFGVVGSPDGAEAEPGDPSADEGSWFSPSLTRTGSAVGTPAYMAPEQHRRQAASAASDQFSFCVALYEALYGVRPFTGETSAELLEQVLAGAIRPVAGRAIPDKIHRLLARGLSVRPEARHPSMAMLADALERESRPRSRTRGFFWVAVLAAIAAAPVAALLAGRRHLPPSRPGEPAPAAIPPPGLRTEFFVDATAQGPPTGAASHPYPTITAALAAASRSSAPAKTVHVAAGTYDAAHETFPLELRDGVSLLGEGARTTSIVGVWDPLESTCRHASLSIL